MMKFKEGRYYEHKTSKDLYIHVVEIKNIEANVEGPTLRLLYNMDIFYIRATTLAIQTIGNDLISDDVTIYPDMFKDITNKIRVRKIGRSLRNILR